MCPAHSSAVLVLWLSLSVVCTWSVCTVTRLCCCRSCAVCPQRGTGSRVRRTCFGHFCPAPKQRGTRSRVREGWLLVSFAPPPALGARRLRVACGPRAPKQRGTGSRVREGRSLRLLLWLILSLRAAGLGNAGLGPAYAPSRRLMSATARKRCGPWSSCSRPSSCPSSWAGRLPLT